MWRRTVVYWKNEKALEDWTKAISTLRKWQKWMWGTNKELVLKKVKVYHKIKKSAEYNRF